MKYLKFCVKKRYCIYKHFTQFFLFVLLLKKASDKRMWQLQSAKTQRSDFATYDHRNLPPLFEKKMKSTNTMSSSSLKTFDYVLVQWLENIVLQHFHQFGVLFSFVNETKNVCSYGYMRILNRNTDVKS